MKKVLFENTAILSSYLGSSDRKAFELSWNLGGILQDDLQDFSLTTADQSFKFLQLMKKAPNGTISVAQ